MAALLAGQGITEVATQYNLDVSIVSRWRSAMPDEQLQVVAIKKSHDIEVLLFKYLTQTLITLDEQAKVVSEREYIIKQPAGELAVLHGVMADKAIRLLEAAERARAALPAESAAAA
jgi:transposase-like protein